MYMYFYKLINVAVRFLSLVLMPPALLYQAKKATVISLYCVKFRKLIVVIW